MKLGQRGAGLVEALVAVLLFSIGIIALLRVLAVSVETSGDIEYRAVAATIANETIGRMWVDPTNLAAYAETDAVIDGLPSGTRTVTVNGNVVNVTISWSPPGELVAHTHNVAATLIAN